jgi:hypothetical protein
MRIAYITLDDVNRFLMRRWAERGRFRADCPAATRLGPPLDGVAAVVLDLDFLPAPTRAAWMTHVLAGAATPVLVHGHNITDAEVSALRRRGVAICRGRLCRTRLLAWLRQLEIAAMRI